MDYTITALSDHTGAEIRGIDLARPVDEADRAAFYRAFVDHSVLVFRDQHLTADQLLAAVGMFGAVFPQYDSRFALPECPEIHYISNQDFYPDGKRYIAACPPKATVLHAVRLPDKGGDTQYVNMHLAYDGLPDETRRRIDRLKAIHVYQSRHSERKLMALGETDRGHVRDAVVHPLVRTQP